jgi:hypothetical protein
VLLVGPSAWAAAKVAVVAGLPVLVRLQTSELLSLLLLKHRAVPLVGLMWSWKHPVASLYPHARPAVNALSAHLLLVAVR